MRRYGLSPSDDERWDQMAQDVIKTAEHEDVGLREFYRGLVAIIDALEDRLSVSEDELDADEDD